MSIENGLRRLNRYGLGKVPNPNEPGNPGPHRIGDPDYPGSGPESGDVGDNPYKLDPYWGHPTPGPGFNPDDTYLTPDPPYMHSMATHSLRQAGYNPYQANHLIRLARRGQLQQDATGAYHDPTQQQTYDPTPAVPDPRANPNDASHQSQTTDPVVGDERPFQPTDPGYYGGFKSPGVQQGLETISARWAPKRAARAARQAARGPR